jgi:hypothetical protein
MKTKDEIQAKIDDLLLEYNDVKDWHDKAYERYQKDRNFWGKDADRGEVDHASDIMSDCHNKIKILKWVLNDGSEL